jgi:hypothetical protein
MTYVSEKNNVFFYLTPGLRKQLHDLGVAHYGPGFPEKGEMSDLGKAAIMLMLAMPKEAQDAALAACESLKRVKLDAALSNLRRDLRRVASEAEDVPPEMAREAVAATVQAVREIQKKTRKEPG